MDVVQLIAVSLSAGALVPFLREILPRFIAARRSDARITVKIGNDKLTVEGGNAVEAEKLIKALLDSIPTTAHEDALPASPQEDPGADG